MEAAERDPYIHRIGDYVVKVSFQEKEPKIEDQWREYLRYREEKGELFSFREGEQS